MGLGEGEGQRSYALGPWKFHGKDYRGRLHHEVLEVSTDIGNFHLCVGGHFPECIFMSFPGVPVP